MPLSSLPPEILSVVLQDSSQEDIKRLVFVSKDFRTAVRRLLWQSVEISSLKKMKFVLALFGRRPFLGRAVMRLNISFRQIQRTGGQTKTLSTISKVQFIRLIRLTPLLRSLSIREPTFESFTPEELSDKSLFPCLETLRFFADRSSNALSNLLSMAPGVGNLSMHFTHPHHLVWSNPFPSCPTLFILECQAKDLFYAPQKSLLPSTSLRQLEYLSMICDRSLTPDHISAIVDLIANCSSTLSTIAMEDIFDFEYAAISPLFPTLTSLYNLAIKFHDTPVDVFQHVPATLLEFGSLLSIEHLEHLHSHPRPSLNLQWIQFDDLILGSVKFIPSTVRVIIFEQINLIDLGQELSLWIEELESRGRMNLEFISVHGIIGPHTKEEKSSILERFKVLEIDFVFESWGTGEEGDEVNE